MHPRAGTRYVLAPGLRVVRRGPDLLQVGLYAARRAVLPATPVSEHVLAALLERRPVDDGPETAAVLDLLHRRGCLVPETPSAPTGPVAVLGSGPLATHDAPDLLRACGAVLTRWSSSAAVTLVVGEGELDRDLLDPLLRARTAHVVVRLVDGGAVLGPFVQPGTTACLRCVDAQVGVDDPHHVAVTARYVRAGTRPRGDGVPDAVDPALAALALGWAVREVTAYLAGRRPSAWSRTLELGPEPSQLVDRTWDRDPRCGCCWAADDRGSGTMDP